MERKSSPKILQLMQYVPRSPLCYSTKTSGPSRRAWGLPFFVIYMIRIMPSSMLLFVMPLGTGFDQSRPGDSPSCAMECFLQSDK